MDGHGIVQHVDRQSQPYGKPATRSRAVSLDFDAQDQEQKVRSRALRARRRLSLLGRVPRAEAQGLRARIFDREYF